MKRKAFGIASLLLAVILLISVFASCTDEGKQPEGGSTSENTESGVPSDGPGENIGSGESSQPDGNGDNTLSGSESVTDIKPDTDESGTTNDDGWSKYY